MSQVTITLPDGSSRSVPAGTPVRDVATAISPRLAKAALAATVDDRLVDLTYPLNADARSGSSREESAEALPLYRHSTAHLLAAAVTNLFPGVQCGIGPADRRRLLLRLRRPAAVRARGPRGHREEDARAGASRICVYERQMWPREEAKRFFGARGEPLKVQLIDEKTEGQTRGLLLHDQGQGDVRRLLRRPARAVHRQAQGVQAAHARRTPTGRATRATSRCSASTARRSSPRRSCRSTCTGSRRPRSATTGRSAATRSCSCSTSGRRARRSGCRRARCSTTRWRNYMRGVLFPAGYIEVKAPIVFNKALWETSGHWQHYRENMFLVESRRRADGPEGDELPRPLS